MADPSQEIDAGRRMDMDFSREEYRLKAQIISSGYAAKCINLINQYDFSTPCKIVLGDIVNVSFDPNAVLSRQDNLTIRKLDLKVALNLAVSAMDASDIANPGLLNVQNEIEMAFGDFISRAYLGEERKRIGQSETISHQNYTGLAGPQEPKRGFEVPWRRGGP